MIKDGLSSQNISKEMNQGLKQIAKGSIIAFGGKIAGVFLGFVFSIIIARLLGPAIMGTFFLGITIMSILSVFCICGLRNGLLRYISIYRAENKPAYIKGAVLKGSYFSASIGLIAGCLLFIFSKFISNVVFSNPELTNVLKVFALLLPLFSLWRIYLEVLRGFKAIVHIVINQNLLLPLSSILFLMVFYILMGKSAVTVSLAYSFSVIFVFLAVIYSLTKTFPEFKTIPAKDEFKNILRYSLPLLFIGVVGLLLFWIDTVMLGILRTPKEVGIYTAAVKIAAFVSFFLLSVNSFIPPFFAEYYNKGMKKELGKIARTSARWIFYFSLPIAIAFILMRKEIMGVYGMQFTAGIWALTFLCIGQLINASAGSVGYILIMTGHQRNLAKIMLISAGLNVFLNSIFIPIWGISGAGMATAVSLSFLNILMALSVYKNIGIKAYADNLARIGCITSLSVVLFFSVKMFTNPYMGIFSFIALYGFLTYFWGIKNEDKEFLVLIMKRLKKGINYAGQTA